MSKFPRIQKITKEQEQELLIDLCRAIAKLKTPEEAAQFLKDLLSKQEAQMLAKRVAIARCIIEGRTYEEIQEYLKVSYGTVARVSNWLATSGEGYKLVVERVKPEKSNTDSGVNQLEGLSSWRQLKRKYPVYYWPELMLEEMIKKANKKEKERLKSILERFNEKSELFDKLRLILRGEQKASYNM